MHGIASHSNVFNINFIEDVFNLINMFFIRKTRIFEFIAFIKLTKVAHEEQNEAFDNYLKNRIEIQFLPIILHI